VFNGPIEIKIADVTHKVKTDANKAFRRITEVPLRTELSEEIAAALGPACEGALEHLKSGVLNKGPSIDLQQREVKITFDDNTQAETGKHVLEAFLDEARTKPPRKEGLSPTVEIAIGFATKPERYCWLVERIKCPMWVTIETVGEQGKLPGTSKSTAKRKAAQAEAQTEIGG